MTSLTVVDWPAPLNPPVLPEQFLSLTWWSVPKGEGCVALRAAQLCYMEFEITLTHQGETTGRMTGGIQLRTSEGKPTEKLYGESGCLAGTGRSLILWSWCEHQLFSYFPQILSKLKRMTLLTQKAKVATSTSKCIILHWWYLVAAPVWAKHER